MRHRKRASLGLAALAGAAAVAAGVVAFSGGGSEASAAESCQGLDTALQNNLTFIAQQQAAPDAQSAARIANREAVVAQLQQRRQVAGCTGELVARPIVAGSGESCAGLDTALRNNLDFIARQQAAPDAQSAARIENRQAVVDLIEQRRAAAGCTAVVQPTAPAENPTAPGEDPAGNPAENPAENPENPAENPENPAQPPASGEVVCDGSTVTLSGEAGAPAASSSQFPAGTRLKVTNLDNGKSITVEVTGVSGSCVLLNDAAFEQVREPGRFLIRRAVVERVG